MKINLVGKVALVTGGASGIGRATALAFARQGANIVVVDRKIEAGKEIVNQIEKIGSEAFFIQTDVSRSIEVQEAIDKTINKFGRLDYASNNAGVAAPSSLIELSETDWNYLVDVNLKGIWLCLKYEIPAMLAQDGGAIVNIASIAGVIGLQGYAAYGATKGGVIALTRGAAIEYAQSGIRINTVSPGPTETQALKKLPTEKLAQIASWQPVARNAKPEEIADAVLWLCSDSASFVTGQNLVVDGGHTVW
jgi:NAD(P)-dependent dehydrogenase (short-subunit alcohol dehydrogenase family)